MPPEAKRGKVTYKATTNPRGALFHLPPGYQVVESPNGVVSVVRERERKILDSEQEALEAAEAARAKDGNLTIPPSCMSTRAPVVLLVPQVNVDRIELVKLVSA